MGLFFYVAGILVRFEKSTGVIIALIMMSGFHVFQFHAVKHVGSLAMFTGTLIWNRAIISVISCTCDESKRLL